MKLEEQVVALAQAGLPLAEGRTVEELEEAESREEYENDPYVVLLMVLGTEVQDEPWGRWFCDRAWMLDAKCIADSGDYVEVFTQLARIADRPDAVEGARDHVDLEAGEAWLDYTIDGERRHLVAKVEDDWVDAAVVRQLVADLEHDGRRFYGMDNGQSTVLFFGTEAMAGRVNDLAGRDLLAVFEG